MCYLEYCPYSSCNIAVNQALHTDSLKLSIELTRYPALLITLYERNSLHSGLREMSTLRKSAFTISVSM